MFLTQIGLNLVIFVLSSVDRSIKYRQEDSWLTYKGCKTYGWNLLPSGTYHCKTMWIHVCKEADTIVKSAETIGLQMSSMCRLEYQYISRACPIKWYFSSWSVQLLECFSSSSSGLFGNKHARSFCLPSLFFSFGGGKAKGDQGNQSEKKPKLGNKTCNLLNRKVWVRGLLKLLDNPS